MNCWLKTTQIIGLVTIILGQANPSSYADDKADKISQQMTGKYGSSKKLSGVIRSFQNKTTISGCSEEPQEFLLQLRKQATGDLKARVTLEGKYKTSQHLTPLISGICAKGMIACTPGTWENCQGYEWTLNHQTAQLFFQKSDQVGACYCINNSCDGREDLDNLHTDLGAPAAALLQSEFGFRTSSARATNREISYKGSVEGDSCEETAKALSKNFEPKTAQKHNQQADVIWREDPQNLVSLVESQISVETHTCSITQNIHVDERRPEIQVSKIKSDKHYFCGGRKGVEDLKGALCVITGDSSLNIQMQPCGEPGCHLISIGDPGDNYLHEGSCALFIVDFQIQLSDPSTFQKAILENVAWDDHTQILIGGNHVFGNSKLGPPILYEPSGIPLRYYAKRCEAGESFKQTLHQDVSSHFAGGHTNITVKLAVSRKGEFHARFKVYLDPSICTLNESTSNDCQSFTGNEIYQLYEETVDDVITHQNYQSTGNTPPHICTQVPTACGPKEVCKQRWNTQKTYTRTKKPHDIDAKNLQQTLKSFDDLVSIGLVPESEQTCTMSCKVQVPHSRNIQATTDFQTNDFQKKSNRSHEELRLCVKDNLCPVAAEEKVLERCQERCGSDSFSKALQMMSILDSSAKDFSKNPQNIEIFKGTQKSCRHAGSQTNGFSCCNLKEEDLKAGGTPIIKENCSSEDMAAALAKSKGVVTAKTTYCTSRSVVYVAGKKTEHCHQYADSYCVFESKLAKAFQTQGRPQLQDFGKWVLENKKYRPKKSNGFGSGTGKDKVRLDCRGFKVEEFASIDFDQIDLSDALSDIENNVAAKQERTTQNIQSKIQSYYQDVQTP